jgi:hypothetical protein
MTIQITNSAIANPATDATPAELADIRASLGMQQTRKRILRPFWEAYKAQLMTLYPPVPNTGSVVYVDPSAGTDGAGTFASPRNVMPTAVSNTTYLFRERTRIVSSGQFTGITATGLVFGTYSAATGVRIFEPSRLATIDGGTYFRVAFRWQGTSGTLALSGVRIVGGQNASGGVNLFECITAPAASTITIEHCLFEDMGSFQPFSGQLLNLGIAINGAKSVIRFNRIALPGDGMSLAPGAGAGYEIIGNDITVAPSIALGGPDCVEVQRTGANALGQQIVIGNWLNQAANTKHAFLSVGGTPQSTGEEMLFSRNFLFGVDVGANPPVPPFGSQIAFTSNTTSVQLVVGNYFDQFIGWASVGNNSMLANNIGIRDHAGEWLVGFSTQAGSSGAVIANNTAIALNTTWTGGATNRGFESNGSHTFINNVCVNLGMKYGGGATESHSVFVGGLPVNLSNAPVALGTGSITAADAMLDDVGRPLAGSPVLAAGGAVQHANIRPRYADIFGSHAWDLLPIRGAAQDYPN